MSNFVRFPLIVAAVAGLALGLSGCSKKEETKSATQDVDEDKPRVEEKYGFTTDSAGG